MLYLVENPEWKSATIAIFQSKGSAWHSYANLGYVARGVAQKMVDAGIAQWDSKDEIPPNSLDRKNAF